MSHKGKKFHLKMFNTATLPVYLNELFHSADNVSTGETNVTAFVVLLSDLSCVIDIL